ncbi:MAG: peptidylprolyl isomerase [Campylobacterota bacterium]|nr:peptidylprolyl isomerase [Campylobacterota bacterium]
MISWMQKHNKYLIVTIWIATIAFIGAGFVGWGSYQYGSKAGSIGKVGDIEIGKPEFDMAYSDLYQRYNQMMQGKLDEAKAREMGLAQQAFSTLAVQALLLNLANEFGIIVSDEELGYKLSQIPSFQKEGKFNIEIYEGFLKSRRMKAKTFEQVIQNETIIQKMFSLLDSKSLSFEIDVFAAAINVSDKIAYRVLTADDLNLTTNEEKLKSYWEAHKSDYMTPKKYQLDILWTESKDANTTNVELEEFYAQNSFNYIDTDGKQLLLEDAREKVLADLKMKKSKKHAQKQYIGFKKGKIDKSETMTLALNDTVLASEAWKEVQSKDINTILKPKAIGNRYATIKVVSIIEPKEMSFDEAKTAVTAEYEKVSKAEGLTTLAESTLKNFDESRATVSDFVTLDSRDALSPLTLQETLQFLQKLFTSQKENGIITIENKVVVYRIIEQKMAANAESNNTELVKSSVNQIKTQDLQTNLLKSLDQKYKTKKFVEGI